MNRKYLGKKLLYAVITVIAVLVLNFFLFRIMPGDPVSMIVRNPNLSREAAARIRESFGLDRPLLQQFFIYCAGLLRGDMGDSFLFHKPVAAVITERLGASMLLTVVAELIAIALGTALGTLAAWRRGKRIDIVSLGFSLLTYAMPTFWLGVLLVAFFSGFLRLFPTSGMFSSLMIFAGGGARFFDLMWHLFLPSLTLALVLIGEYMLVMRSTLIDVLTEDYIVTARAKGLREKALLVRHALPNAMIPMVTIISMNLGFTITGALPGETGFSWPGLGRRMYDALQARDYPLLQGIFFVTSLCVIGANFLADLLYGYLDPRVRT